MERKGKILVTVVGAVMSVLLAMSVSVAGQSGRGRQPAVPPPKPTPQPQAPGGVATVAEGGKLARQETSGITSRYQLRNGLTVLVRERHGAPLVAVTMGVRAGWASDPKGMEGLAKLTQQVILESAGGSTEREVARLGGSILSGVEAGFSWVTIVAPAESYAGVVGKLASLMLNPDFSDEVVSRSGRILCLREAEDAARPGNAGLRGMLATAFAGSALGNGGLISETMAVTAEQAGAFYRQYYEPSRSIIVVTGDIFSLPALNRIQLDFGGYTRMTAGGGGSNDGVAAEKLAEGLRYGNGRSGSGLSHVAIGYRVATNARIPSKEQATLRLMAAILGLGKGSRLWQGLREGAASRDRKSVAIETSAEYASLPGYGLLLARLVVEPERIDRAEAEYFREIERFRREIVSAGEIDRARAMLEKRYYDAMASFESEGLVLAREQLLNGDYRTFDEFPAQLREVTAKDVQAAAAKYLTTAAMVVYEIEPLRAAPRTFTPEKYAELVATFAPGAGQAIKPEDIRPATVLKTFAQGAERVRVVEGQNVIVAPMPLPVKDFSVLRGPRAYVREDKSHPKLALTIVFQGGRLVEEKTTSGTTELMLRSMLKSTATRKADLLALELESYGADLRIVNEPDFYGFSLEVLSRNAEPAAKLLLEIIEKPFFDKEEVAKERELLLADQQRDGESPALLSSELMRLALFPNHPYGLPRHGLAEVVKAIDETKLEAWHEKTVRRQYPLVTLVGDTDGSSMVSRIFSDGLRRGDLDRTLKVNLPTQFPPAQDRVAESGAPITSQTIGFRILSQSLTGQYDLQALTMLEHLLASGRMPDDLREKGLLTASISTRMEQRLAAGLFQTRLTTRPGDETGAIDTVLRSLQQLAGNDPSDEEFEFARNAAIGRYAIALQSHIERSLEYSRAALYGRKPADVESQPEAMVSVRKTDLRRVAEGTFRNIQIGRGIVRGPQTVNVKSGQ